MGHTVRRGWDNGFIRDGSNRAEGFCRLGICDDGTVGGVDSGEITVFSLATFENAWLGVIGSVVFASDTVINVLTPLGSVRTCWVTSLEAETTSAHEICPLVDLNKGRVIRAKGSRIHNASHWVAAQISTMGVHLTAKVAGSHIDKGLVKETISHDVVWGPYDLEAGKSTLRDDASTTASFCAPSNHLTLQICNSRVGCGGSPQAKIIDTVEKGGLTERIRALCS